MVSENTVLLRDWSEAELTGSKSKEALDLGFISSILLPTELATTNIIPLESTDHYGVGRGTSAFTWFESSSDSKPVFSID